MLTHLVFLSMLTTALLSSSFPIAHPPPAPPLLPLPPSSSSPRSHDRRYAVFNGTSGKGPTDAISWPDGVCGHPCRLYDPTNLEGRKWWWSQVKEGYFDYGIEIFWLDAAEPEQANGPPAGSSFQVGSFQANGMLFPYYHAKTYHEGLLAAGATEGMVLSRSAWAGMQKFRAALWNGDTSSEFSYLTKAIYAMQNIEMSGIAWWTTGTGKGVMLRVAIG